jgi:hypothetical protein
MSDGIWNAATALEPYRQARIVRHKPLRINLDPAGALNDEDQSSYGSVAPSSLIPVSSDRGLEGGPHFVLSPETPDGRPTLGFEWCLLFHNDATGSTLATAPGFTVTIWSLISATFTVNGLTSPQWASFEPLTGVNFRELYHTFDTNACAIRFQIENYAGAAPDTSISIYLCEL